jgi:hypothetical protein
MPREPRTVDKDRSCCWDVVVVVDEESQICHCLVSAVRRNAELGRIPDCRAIDIVGADVIFVFESDAP